MSGAPIAPAKPTRTAGLLSLVRKLIDYGTFLAATLRQRGLGDYPAIQGRQFGTTNVTLILARIARGLLRAAALEARLQQNATRLDVPPRPRIPRTHPPSPATDPTSDPPTPRHRANPRYADDDETLLAHPPTPEQIAADIRRPIGAVLADICRDLGIMPCHPLWRDLHTAIMFHGGNLAALIKDIFQRRLSVPITERDAEPVPTLPAALLSLAASLGTGPP